MKRLIAQRCPRREPSYDTRQYFPQGCFNWQTGTETDYVVSYIVDQDNNQPWWGGDEKLTLRGDAL
jgi:hypothetical protein